MKSEYLQRHHRQTILITGITDMLLNANATSGAEIFAVETYELMATKTPPHQLLRSLGGIFILMLMAGYWHWYVGMATIHRWWSSVTLLLLFIGTVGGNPLSLLCWDTRTCVSGTFSDNRYCIDAAIYRIGMICCLLTGAINAEIFLGTRTSYAT